MSERHTVSLHRPKTPPLPEQPRVACEAVAPDGRVCTKHRTEKHRNKKHHARGDSSWDTWDGGRDGMPAIWTRDKPNTYQGPGDMSEGEWQAYGQYGY